MQFSALETIILMWCSGVIGFCVSRLIKRKKLEIKKPIPVARTYWQYRLDWESSKD
jgi:hypothetical protein